MSWLNTFSTGVGIDVSQHHIRLAQVSKFDSIKNLLEIDLPDGLIVDDQVIAPEEVGKLISKNIQTQDWITKGTKATLLIPDSRVFFSGFSLPSSLDSEELELRALRLAQKEIPLPFSKAKVAVTQGEKLNGQARVTVYAIEETIANGFLQAFSGTPFRLIAVEANSKAVFRFIHRMHLKQKQDVKSDEMSVVVDIGHAWTTVSAYSSLGSCLYSRSLAYQHDYKNIETVQKLPKGVVDVIADSLKDLMIYFSNQEREIKEVFLSGVEAQDKHVQEIIDELETPDMHLSRVGNILELPGVKAPQVHTFGAAIGAAIRSAHIRHYQYQHNLLK